MRVERTTSSFCANGWRTAKSESSCFSWTSCGRIRRDFLQLSGEAEEKWLCRKLVESHRRIYRKHPPEEDTGVESSLMTAVTGLGLEYRWPFVLKESVDFSYGELAEILGIPEPTVRNRIARARAQVRRHLEGAQE